MAFHALTLFLVNAHIFRLVVGVQGDWIHRLDEEKRLLAVALVQMTWCVFN